MDHFFSTIFEETTAEDLTTTVRNARLVISEQSLNDVVIFISFIDKIYSH